MIIESEKETSEKLKETKEMRLILSDLSQKSKENILKGMAMFAAGYNVGYVDGVNSADKRNFV